VFSLTKQLNDIKELSFDSITLISNGTQTDFKEYENSGFSHDDEMKIISDRTDSKPRRSGAPPPDL
jgi:hypothetical protein